MDLGSHGISNEPDPRTPDSQDHGFSFRTLIQAKRGHPVIAESVNGLLKSLLTVFENVIVRDMNNRETR